MPRLLSYKVPEFTYNPVRGDQNILKQKLPDFVALNRFQEKPKPRNTFMSKVHQMNEDSRDANTSLYHIRDLTREPHNVADKIATKAVHNHIAANIYSFNAGRGHITTYTRDGDSDTCQDAPTRVRFQENVDCLSSRFQQTPSLQMSRTSAFWQRPYSNVAHRERRLDDLDPS